MTLEAKKGTGSFKRLAHYITNHEFFEEDICVYIKVYTFVLIVCRRACKVTKKLFDTNKKKLLETEEAAQILIAGGTYRDTLHNSPKGNCLLRMFRK